MNLKKEMVNMALSTFTGAISGVFSKITGDLPATLGNKLMTEGEKILSSLIEKDVSSEALQSEKKNRSQVLRQLNDAAAGIKALYDRFKKLKSKGSNFDVSNKADMAELGGIAEEILKIRKKEANLGWGVRSKQFASLWTTIKSEINGFNLAYSTFLNSLGKIKNISDVSAVASELAALSTAQTRVLMNIKDAVQSYIKQKASCSTPVEIFQVYFAASCVSSKSDPNMGFLGRSAERLIANATKEMSEKFEEITDKK